jgi:hypothetical protein
MKNELQDKLIKEFPNLYKQVTLSPQETCMCWGFCCGDGWFQIIFDLSKKITELDPNIEAIQVKEKFGGLRFYIEPVDKNKFAEVYKTINDYENESFKTCEICGTKENVHTQGPNWIKTLCDNCRNEWSNKN